MQTNLKVLFNSREVPADKIQAWELKRARKVIRKLGSQPRSNNLEDLRMQLIEIKTALGYDGLFAKLRAELAIGDKFAGITSGLSFGARRFSIVEIHSETGTAEKFIDWFETRGRIGDEKSMLMGTPDHYVIRNTEDGTQEVIETTGGSPLAARFMIDYEDLSSLRSPRNASYPFQMAGVARASNGKAIGGVRHQFRNNGKGFEAKLTVEFPFMITPGIVGGHRWHLANEFSNWIKMALAT